MKQLDIVIAEDDKWYAELLQYQILLNPDNHCQIVNNGKELIKSLPRKPDVITLDFNLPDLNGKELLKIIQSDSPETSIIIISGQEDISTAIDLINDGAYDYIVKNEHTKDRLWNSLNKIREHKKLVSELEDLKQEVSIKYDFSKTVIGQSAQIKSVFALMQKASNSNINVSITGETGTGKEVVAKAIHYNSNLKKHPFVAINMSAIPSELMESELFGYEKGAFTGANDRKAGKFEAAGNGTIFLDEIGDLDLGMQAKLLRVLQEREVTRLGSNTVTKINCRVICATHKDLAEEVKNGNFRQDLYFRMIGLPINLGPLRSRKEDIPLLAIHFMNIYCKDNKIERKTFDESAINKLISYPFPGNVRELKATIDLAMVMSEGNKISSEDIVFYNSPENIDIAVEGLTLKEYNERLINYLLDKHNNNVLEVAKILDIGKSTIYRMLKEKN